jgi:phytanoyl-CoA hydroxylase
MSCVGIWLAVEDATISNSCLHIAPRSHGAGVAKRMTRLADGSNVEWRDGRPDFSALELRPLETPAGTLVVLHGANVHGSSANTSPESRHAYTMHVVEGKDGYRWLPDNWLQRPPDRPFVPLYDDT